MMKRAIDESLSGIELDLSDRMVIWNRIQELEQSGEKGYLKAIKPYRRPLRVLIAVIILIFSLSALCIAAELPSKLIDLFESVNEVIVYDGIEMRILSAVADDDSVMILYSLKDLEDDRISETTSVYDFSLSRASTLGTYSVGYDEKTKTATFCMAGDNGYEMKGKRLTMSVHSFLNGAPMKLHETKLNVADLLQNQSGATGFRNYIADDEDSFWNAQNQKGADLQEKFEEEEQFVILTEGSMNVTIPGVDWVTVKNIGYKDGWLHVQVKYDSNKEEINNGYICLSDSEGNELNNAILNTPLPGDCEEFIIKAGSLEELNSLYLSGVYTNNESLNTGKWQTTFKVKGVETKSFECVVETDSVKISKAVFSPLGITVYGAGTQEESIRIRMKDGTDIVSEGYSCSGDEETGVFECKYKFPVPIDIQAVDSIEIAGQEVAIPQNY
jgi:hypothetical protein